MKRLNYYQVHKNKKPKRLKNKKPSFLQIQSALIAMQSFTQHAIIVSNKFSSVSEKSLAVLENVKNHADAVKNLFKKEKTNRYLQRK
jgi:hypothetical protein